MTYGVHRFEFEVIQGWEQLPDGWSFVEVAGVAVDSHDRVYVFNRGEHPVIVFDKDGRFLTAWGEDVFTSAHGIYIDRDDTIYLTDDADHTVRVLNMQGELRMTIGTPGVASRRATKWASDRCCTPASHSIASPTWRRGATDISISATATAMRGCTASHAMGGM